MRLEERVLLQVLGVRVLRVRWWFGSLWKRLGWNLTLEMNFACVGSERFDVLASRSLLKEFLSVFSSRLIYQHIPIPQLGLS